MSKGPSRPPQTIRHHREGDLGGGIAETEGCTRRIVRIASDQSAPALRAMRSGTVAIVGEQIVIRRHGHVVATVISDRPELRRCLEAGLRYEAELDKTSDRDGLRVPVRPLARR
jgi:hypothetical protein